MIGNVMLFLLAVSGVAAIAAALAEDGLRRVGFPTRGLWLASMAAPLLLLVLPWLLPSPTDAAQLAGIPVIILAPLTLDVGSSPGFLTLGVALAATWVLGSFALAMVLVRTQRLLGRERQAWDRTRVSGHDVFLSVDRGPAVAGVLRPWIVLPRWALSLSEAELRLVVLHEEEHLRARDTLLLAGALTLLTLTPWNPIAWWQLRRLRTAMEVDCDRRVLRREPDRGQYGSSLLTVAARASGLSLGLAAFTEKSQSLETRIVAMTPNRSRWTRVRAAVFVLLALVVGVQACSVDSPVTTDDAAPEEGVVELPARQDESSAFGLRREPTFTPFTAAPQITNRDEVVAAMEREYPPLLREAGIGGRIVLYFFIDATGEVGEMRVSESSGHPALDEAALAVGEVYRFAPAQNRGENVPVWVQFPITFKVR